MTGVTIWVCAGKVRILTTMSFISRTDLVGATQIYHLSIIHAPNDTQVYTSCKHIATFTDLQKFVDSLTIQIFSSDLIYEYRDLFHGGTCTPTWPINIDRECDCNAVVCAKHKDLPDPDNLYDPWVIRDQAYRSFEILKSCLLNKDRVIHGYDLIEDVTFDSWCFVMDVTDVRE
jgi:hypothetical protein